MKKIDLAAAVTTVVSVAAAIAYRALKVAPAAPGDLCDGELGNFGAYRGIFGSAGDRHRRAKFGSQVLRVAR